MAAADRRAFDLAALDMAGTTVDDHGVVYGALRAAVEDRLGDRIPDEVFARWTGTSKRAAVSGLLTECNGSDDAAEEVYRDFTVRLENGYAEQPPVALPGVAEAIESLRGGGIKVVLQTGYARDVAETIVKGIGWSVGDQIDGLVTSDEVSLSRPAPYLIFAAMELTGVTAVQRVLAAGDTPNDLWAGRNAGVGLVVGVLSGAHPEEELATHPHTHLLRSVAELPALL